MGHPGYKRLPAFVGSSALVSTAILSSDFLFWGEQELSVETELADGLLSQVPRFERWSIGEMGVFQQLGIMIHTCAFYALFSRWQALIS